MDRTQKIEEALSIIWEEREKKSCDKETIRKKIFEKIGEDILEDLAGEGYIIAGSDSVKLTPKGEVMARDITRRQRLAERLLTDVLELDRKAMDSSACEFEHIISKEVEESICTLLGHPKECPHGLPIPPGDCCAKAKGLLESIVVPLTKFKPGETGRIVYVLTREHPQLHKLMSLGVVPGVLIQVHQIFPSFVIQVAETQLALEKDIANEIYVKKTLPAPQ
jgi:DtxR family Mn-dependent transcriptional regulator